MYLAYNTNGLAHHRLEDALRLLADAGYQGVALTPDVQHLDPGSSSEREWERTRELLERLRLRCVVETGARYALDPRRKHWPNLVTQEPCAARRRLEYYARVCKMAQVVYTGNPVLPSRTGLTTALGQASLAARGPAERSPCDQSADRHMIRRSALRTPESLADSVLRTSDRLHTPRVS